MVDDTVPASDRTTRRAPGPRHPIDAVGAVLLTGMAMVAIYGLVEAGRTSWTAPTVRIALSLTLVLGVLFFATEAQRSIRPYSAIAPHLWWRSWVASSGSRLQRRRCANHRTR